MKEPVGTMAGIGGEAAGAGKASVVGGGRMGVALAQILAGAGWIVSLIDSDDGVRNAAVERIRSICELRGQDPAAAERVSVHGHLADGVTGADLVIEAVPEKLELKQAIFAELDGLCGPATVLATNTSVIPVTAVGARTRHPERVVGTHFWNPPYAVRLVEVVRTVHTSDDTIARTMAWMRGMGQKPVFVNKDSPGFIGNRLQHALKREAIALVEEGVCDAETVDFVVKNSFGARLAVMGPLEQSDLVGLGLTLDIHRVLLPYLSRASEPQKLLVNAVAAGELGARVGRGFRDWTPEARQELEMRLDQALLSAAKA